MHRPPARRPARLFHAGQNVLISWQGTGPGGLSSGTGNLSSDHFQRIAAVDAGNGQRADGRLLFNAEFPAGVSAGRGYRAPWYPSDG